MSAKTPEEYLENIDDSRKLAFKKLYDTINAHIPAGFENQISYGMIGWVVPHSTYAEGYHCSPELPLPFLSIAAQKNFFAVYHMGIYADTEVLDWFVAEYPKHCQRKLDMGKSCIRFKKIEDIPYDLIGELCQKIGVEKWIKLYEKTLKK